MKYAADGKMFEGEFRDGNKYSGILKYADGDVCKVYDA